MDQSDSVSREQPELDSDRFKQGNYDNQRASRIPGRRESDRPTHLARPSSCEATGEQYTSGPDQGLSVSERHLVQKRHVIRRTTGLSHITYVKLCTHS